MIKEIRIFGLFSEFDYNLTMPEKGQQLILTGPNGYGKTTILAIIKAICSLDLLYFYSIPFRFIRVYYDSYELDIVSINKNEDAMDDNQVEIHHGINFNLIDSKSYKLVATLATDNQRIAKVEKSLAWQPLIEASRTRKQGFSKIKGLSDADSVRQRKEILEKIARQQTSLGPFMFIMRNLSENAKYIQAQRLIDSNSHVEIKRVAAGLSNYLNHNYFRFLSNSQRHDSKFIGRLMSDEGKISREEYDSKMVLIASIISEASRFDLGGGFELPAYTESKAEILKSYIEDLIEKLSIYKEPLKDLGLFERLIEQKNFVGKRSVFSRRDGIRFVAAGDSANIPLDVLSSGEKNQIIMLHDFIFNIENDALLMIDEPEISLHVAWQHEFMKDISEIAKAKNLSVIIATHSPQIIGSRWDECVDLYEIAENSGMPSEVEI